MFNAILLAGECEIQWRSARRTARCAPAFLAFVDVHRPQRERPSKNTYLWCRSRWNGFRSSSPINVLEAVLLARERIVDAAVNRTHCPGQCGWGRRRDHHLLLVPSGAPRHRPIVGRVVVRAVASNSRLQVIDQAGSGDEAKLLASARTASSCARSGLVIWRSEKPSDLAFVEFVHRSSVQVEILQRNRKDDWLSRGKVPAGGTSHYAS